MYKIIITMFFAVAISAMPIGMTASAHEGGGEHEHHGGGGWHPGGGHMGGGWHPGGGWHEGEHHGWHGGGRGRWHNPCWEDGEWVCD